MTGKKMMMVAVLLANSVKKMTTKVMVKTASVGDTFSRGCSWSLIHNDSPDCCKGGRGTEGRAPLHTQPTPVPPLGAGPREDGDQSQ